MCRRHQPEQEEHDATRDLLADAKGAVAQLAWALLPVGVTIVAGIPQLVVAVHMVELQLLTRERVALALGGHGHGRTKVRDAKDTGSIVLLSGGAELPSGKAV